MTPITDTNELPTLRLCCQKQFAVHAHEPLGEILSIVRTQVACELAEKIVLEDKFFMLKMEGTYGTTRADVIVLTQQEYADILREKFKQGLQHAQGFMPEWRK